MNAPESVGPFGASVASAGDVNGDGYADVVIGLSGDPNPNTFRNQVFLYFGGPSGLAKASAITLTSPEGSTTDFGWSAVGVGDVNGSMNLNEVRDKEHIVIVVFWWLQPIASFSMKPASRDAPILIGKTTHPDSRCMPDRVGNGAGRAGDADFADPLDAECIHVRVVLVDHDGFQGRHVGAPTTTYDLLWDERPYPPKAILGTAYEFATGQRLAPVISRAGRPEP